MKKFKYFFIPILGIVIFGFIFNSYINKKYDSLIKTKDISSIKHTYNQIVRDRGGVLKDKMRDDGDLMIFGSSEFSSPVNQNPINMFPNNYANYDVSIYGRAYTQSIQHASILANISNLNKDDKVAIVMSEQWFENSWGIDGSNFAVNFSEQQFYNYFNNDKIDKENKIYYAQRVAKLLKESGEFNEERIYANLYYRDNLVSKAVLTLLKPYYSFKENMLAIKDKVQSIKILESLDDKEEKEVKNINWNEEFEIAEKEAKSKVSNNDIYVDDEYYDMYIRENYDSLKDSRKDLNLMVSKEMEDYQLLLNTCENLEIKPLIILMPVNGLYYDHLGLGVEKRTEFYNKIEEMAEEKGFDVLNLQNKEYEKYYMYDVMHLGWKGWLTINEEMSKYFQGK